MPRTSLLLCGIAACLATVTACGSTVSGSAAATGGTSGASGSGGVGGVTTVAQLGELVSSNTATKNTAHFNLQMSGLLDTTGSGVVKFGNPLEMDERTTMQGFGDIETVLKDNTAYVKVPEALASIMKVTTPWVRIDPNGTSQMDQTMSQSLKLAQQNANPATMIDSIKSAGAITSTKTEQLDGQPTTHYTITVDLKKWLASMDASDTMSTEVNAALKAGLTTEPLDIWVNSDNLPVKFTETMKIDNPAQQGQTITISTVGTYTDWGQPVTITAPPADQVGTLPGN
jgi:hypothetical protein